MTKIFSDVLVMVGLNALARVQRLFWVVEVIPLGLGHSLAFGTRQNRSHRHCPLVAKLLLLPPHIHTGVNWPLFHHPQNQIKYYYIVPLIASFLILKVFMFRLIFIYF